MVHNIQKNWGYKLYQSSGILKIRKHKVKKLDLFPSSGDEKKTSTLLGLLERANLNQLIC
jgi:DNA mismatch repair ATPase MutS